MAVAVSVCAYAEGLCAVMSEAWLSLRIGLEEEVREVCGVRFGSGCCCWGVDWAWVCVFDFKCCCVFGDGSFVEIELVHLICVVEIT